ncbi:hypothetical protein EDB83DRAFT_2441321 [Lactarius deliciosus]|nr:hypothetical protein EDB83DRAFT_2441321 [Lactarius deliciosus]
MHFLHLYVMSTALVASASALVVAPTLKPAEDESKVVTSTLKPAEDKAKGMPIGCKKTKTGLSCPHLTYERPGFFSRRSFVPIVRE